MHVSVTAAGVVIVALSAACSQPMSPTKLVPAASDQASITSPGGDATGTGTGAGAVAGPAAAGQQVPFRGTLEGVVTVTFDPPPSPFASVLIRGMGNATHLGRFSVAIPHRVNFATSTGIGTFEFTAADGDTLTAALTGQAGPPDPAGVLAIVETATITGGTGRFARATGSFTVERRYDTITGTTTGSFEGTVSRPGAGTP